MGRNIGGNMNIILTGMPGAGKSTIGLRLAKALGMGFLDTDELIKEKTGMEPRDFVKANGRDEFARLQDETILEMDADDCVIATGGSVVQSEIGMKHLKKTGKVIYLKYSFEDIERRFNPQRLLAKPSGQSLRDTYDQRAPLYEKYADCTIECTQKSADEVLDKILDAVKGWR